MSGARRAGTAVERFVEASERAPVVLYSDEPPDERLVERFASDRRVEHVETGRLHAISPVGVFPAAEGATWIMPHGAVGGFRTPIVVEGRAPTGGLAVALDQSTARALDLAVGDTVELQALRWTQCAAQGECEPLPAGDAELVGLIRTEQDVVPDPEDWTILLGANADLGDELAEASSMGWVTGVWIASETDPDEFVNSYAAEIANGDITNDASRTSGPLVGAYRAADLERNAVLIGALVVASVSLVIIGQAYGRFLARRRSDVAALSALGMSRSQVAFTGWLPGLLASMLGAGRRVQRRPHRALDRAARPARHQPLRRCDLRLVVESQPPAPDTVRGVARRSSRRSTEARTGRGGGAARNGSNGDHRESAPGPDRPHDLRGHLGLRGQHR